MLKGHFSSAGASVEYGDAKRLFPVGELDATVRRYRDAQLALDGVDGASVIVVAPTSLATSYRLTQHALTVVRVDSLSGAVRREIDTAIDAPIDAFELIQIGKWNSDSRNHSLSEFADA
ncbi:hypothetical protein C463_10100 [Halorubrum californiense DSM 19288]|uniref:DUF8165 domain-containing protein n=1 Tax=Halorubrum californiense DSM 19288 TaxID=1227465 RepID=M0E7G7_9EURY|nr:MULTISPECIES: hypothetical protein [Halorubrum]ELZ42948.1 hypothetical protein C463_10100 [Halorubrum californiense DSM 19288]TKX68818.1 hypothetical protein EXE40_11945 [Halorubrum sp. GN11GM_10-3_MGM]